MTSCESRWHRLGHNQVDLIGVVEACVLKFSDDTFWVKIILDNHFQQVAQMSKVGMYTCENGVV